MVVGSVVLLPPADVIIIERGSMAVVVGPSRPVSSQPAVLRAPCGALPCAVRWLLCAVATHPLPPRNVRPTTMPSASAFGSRLVHQPVEVSSCEVGQRRLGVQEQRADQKPISPPANLACAGCRLAAGSPGPDVSLIGPGATFLQLPRAPPAKAPATLHVPFFVGPHGSPAASVCGLPQVG